VFSVEIFVQYNRSSCIGYRKRKGRIPKSNLYLETAMVEAANSAAKTKGTAGGTNSTVSSHQLWFGLLDLFSPIL
jgi:hypothetical protein